MSQPLGFQEFSGDPEVLLQPQTVLPEQFFGNSRTQIASRTGEYRLLAAVLEEAVRCFQQNAFGTRSRQRRLFLEVEQWIMRQDDAIDADRSSFSFEYICAVLGLDAVWLREGLHRWRESRIERNS